MGALGIRPRVERTRVDHGLGKARARSVTLYDTNMTETKAPRMFTVPVFGSGCFGHAAAPINVKFDQCDYP